MSLMNKVLYLISDWCSQETKHLIILCFKPSYIRDIPQNKMTAINIFSSWSFQTSVSYSAWSCFSFLGTESTWKYFWVSPRQNSSYFISDCHSYPLDLFLCFNVFSLWIIVFSLSFYCSDFFIWSNTTYFLLWIKLWSGIPPILCALF